MKQHKNDLINNLIQKSHTALEDAKLAMDNERFETANNRIYYAIFYIVSALGYSKDFTTSKHSQLQGWFNKTFIKEKIIDIKYGIIYKEAYEHRIKSDYEFTYKPSKQKVEDLYYRASEFVIDMEKFLSK